MWRVICLLATLSWAQQLWVAHLDPDVDPRAFAKQHHLHYNGSVAHLEGFYQFVMLPHSRTRSLEMPGVRWAEPQVERRRFTRQIETRDPLYPAQWHLHDREDVGVNAPEAWKRGYTGKSRKITVAIVDDGLQHAHPDLQGQWEPALSWDFNGNRADPTPNLPYDGHGTSCAGVCCAKRNNGVCGTGVCPDCRVAGFRLIAAPVTDVAEASALAYLANDIDVYSCSWGPMDDGKRFEGPGYVLKRTFENQVEKGRHGKGSVYLWAGGNGRHYGDNCNYDGYANSRYTMAIGALTSRGQQSYYSESCSALMAVAPSSGDGTGITTTDLTGSSGYSSGMCTRSFGGTSSAAPLAAGIVALVLEARPDLTWRDVQHVVAKGATRVQINDGSWSRANERHFQHSERYGFGNLVLPQLLDAAQHHTLVPEATVLCDTSAVHVNRPFSCTHTLKCNTAGKQHSFVEHVRVTVTWSHPCRGQATLSLSNSHGNAVSHLVEAHDDCVSERTTWTFGSVRYWGERLAHEWTIHADDTRNRGRLESVRLVVFGPPSLE